MGRCRHSFENCRGLFRDEPRITDCYYIYDCVLCGRSYGRHREKKGRILPLPWIGTHIGNPGPQSEWNHDQLQRVLTERMTSGQEKPPTPVPLSEDDTLSEPDEPVALPELEKPIAVRELAEELRAVLEKEEDLCNSKPHKIVTIKRLELVPEVQEYKQILKIINDDAKAVTMLKKRKDEILDILINHK